MAQVLRRRGRIQVKVDKREREALIGIIDSLSPRLAAPLASAPRAYDDAKLQAEYDRWVRPDIEKGREVDLTMVREALSGGEDTLPLTEAQTLVWLRAFNHLRVAAGEILGIEADGWEETATDTVKQQPEYGVLMALGYLQEELVAALELVEVTDCCSAGRKAIIGCPIVGGVDHLVVNVPIGVAVRRPARPDLRALLVDTVHQDGNPSLAEVGVDLDGRREHAPTAATWRGRQMRLRLFV